VRLRAEELRGKLMGYYVEKKQQLNVNKTLNDMSEEELENKDEPDTQTIFSLHRFKRT
jgi:hypothetical protein